MLDLEFADKTVVVTGGASNVGRGIVHAFASQQARVVLIDLDEDKAAGTRQEALDLGAADCVFVRADLSTSQGCIDAIGDVMGLSTAAVSMSWSTTSVGVSRVCCWTAPASIGTGYGA